MKRTNYLYGVDPTKYVDLQVALCLEKIKDAKTLLKSLKGSLDFLVATQEQFALQKRVQNIQQAIKYNQELIEEAEGRI